MKISGQEAIFRSTFLLRDQDTIWMTEGKGDVNQHGGPPH